MSLTTPTPSLAEQLIRARRSTRAFRPDPVPRDRLDAIFALASRSPSNANMQPWRAEVVSGATRDRLSAELLAAMAEGRWSPDVPEDPEIYEPHHVERREAMGEILYGALGIGREDEAGRSAWYMDNLRFFGAPHAVFLFMPPRANERMATDVGMYGQTLMLALAAHGVGSCPQGMLGFFADTVRDVLGIADGSRLVYGISFGYADEASAVNHFDMPRVPLAESTRWHD
ncbi:MAG TPA: nitroreductase [Baekduia sp.]|jgi:hypothetical protein